jgi:cell fate regulator YaaT (PSP1 superfamily)
MIKYGVRLLKNTFFALSVPEGVELQHDQLILIRTEKGDEVAKVIRLNSCVAKKWESHKYEVVPFVRVLDKNDLERYKEIQKEEEEAFDKCKVLIKSTIWT